MTRDEVLGIPLGSLMLTPWEPRGIVELVEVEEYTATVRFTHDHAGCKAGTLGRYFISELTAHGSEQM